MEAAEALEVQNEAADSYVKPADSMDVIDNVFHVARMELDSPNNLQAESFSSLPICKIEPASVFPYVKPSQGKNFILLKLLEDTDKRLEGFFAKHRLIDLIFLWLCTVVVAFLHSFPIRIEWLVFCIASCTPLFRSYRSSKLLFLGQLFFMVAFDVGINTVFGKNRVALSIFTSIVMYGCQIGSLRGIDVWSCVIWLVFVGVDLFVKEVPVSSGLNAFVACHTLTYGIYLSLAEVVAIVVEFSSERKVNLSDVYGDVKIYRPISRTRLNSSQFFPVKPSATDLDNFDTQQTSDSTKIEEKIPSSSNSDMNLKSTLRNRNLSSQSSQRLPPPSYTNLLQQKTHSLENSSLLPNSPPPLYNSIFPQRNGSSNSEVPAVKIKCDCLNEDPPWTFGTPSATYYYSNHDDKFNRFELCLIEITNQNILFSWTFTPSLVITLTSVPAEQLWKQKDHEEVLCLPPASFTRTFHKSDPKKTCEFHDIPIILRPLDFKVMVNRVEWTDCSIKLADGQVSVENLLMDTEYEILLLVKDYESVPLRVRTKNIDSEESSPFTTPVDTPKCRHNTLPLSSIPIQISQIVPQTITQESQKISPDFVLEREITPPLVSDLNSSNKIRMSQLEAFISNSNEQKRLQQQQLKKQRKDVSRQLKTLQSEYQVIQKIISKETSNDTKTKQRILFLANSIEQNERAVEDLAESLIDIQTRKKQYIESGNALEVEVNALKDQARKLEKNLAKLRITNEKETDDLKRILDTLQARVTAEKTRLENTRRDITESQNITMPGILKRIEVTKIRFAKVVQDVMDAEKRRAAWIEAARSEVDAFEAALENTRNRNREVRETIEEEKRNQKQLLLEIEKAKEEKARNDRLTKPVYTQEFTRGNVGWMYDGGDQVSSTNTFSPRNSSMAFPKQQENDAVLALVSNDKPVANIAAILANGSGFGGVRNDALPPKPLAQHHRLHTVPSVIGRSNIGSRVTGSTSTRRISEEFSSPFSFRPASHFNNKEMENSPPYRVNQSDALVASPSELELGGFTSSGSYVGVIGSGIPNSSASSYFEMRQPSPTLYEAPESKNYSPKFAGQELPSQHYLSIGRDFGAFGGNSFSQPKFTGPPNPPFGMLPRQNPSATPVRRYDIMGPSAGFAQTQNMMMQFGNNSEPLHNPLAMLSPPPGLRRSSMHQMFADREAIAYAQQQTTQATLAYAQNAQDEFWNVNHASGSTALLSSAGGLVMTSEVKKGVISSEEDGMDVHLGDDILASLGLHDEDQGEMDE
ncbi:hypothetical protein HK096_006944 [Nowakowskiella sp. JEL0078]|nr:hypothetical protein HK096_006944 [Nowakowskiella sp. JEL0078]